jgi:hypothetical protein
VDPTRLEPLTSAVQRRIRTVVVVRWCSKIAANKYILSFSYHACWPLFVWVAARLLPIECARQDSNPQPAFPLLPGPVGCS